MRPSPIPITTPNAALMANWARKYRPAAAPHRPCATVVRWRSREPKSRISRSRRSSCCIRTKTAMMMTMSRSEIGPRTGAKTALASSKGCAAGGRTATGIGCWPGAERGGPAGTRARLAPGRKGLLLVGGRHLPVDPVKHAGKPAHGGAAHGFHLVLDRGRILRDVGRKARDLDPDDAADGQQRSDADDHGKQHGRDMRQVKPPQQVGERPQHEGEKDRHRDRDQHLACEVKGRHHHHATAKVIRLFRPGVSAAATWAGLRGGRAASDIGGGPGLRARAG